MGITPRSRARKESVSENFIKASDASPKKNQSHVTGGSTTASSSKRPRGSRPFSGGKESENDSSYSLQMAKNRLPSDNDADANIAGFNYEDGISASTSEFKSSHWLQKLETTKRRKPRNIKQLLETSRSKYSTDFIYQHFNFSVLEAPPSARPRLKYCDVTGLPVSFTHFIFQLNQKIIPRKLHEFYNME